MNAPEKASQSRRFRNRSVLLHQEDSVGGAAAAPVVGGGGGDVCTDDGIDTQQQQPRPLWPVGPLCPRHRKLCCLGPNEKRKCAECGEYTAYRGMAHITRMGHGTVNFLQGGSVSPRGASFHSFLCSCVPLSHITTQSSQQLLCSHTKHHRHHIIRVYTSLHSCSSCVDVPINLLYFTM